MQLALRPAHHSHNDVALVGNEFLATSRGLGGKIAAEPKPLLVVGFNSPSAITSNPLVAESL